MSLARRTVRLCQKLDQVGCHADADALCATMERAIVEIARMQTTIEEPDTEEPDVYNAPNAHI